MPVPDLFRDGLARGWKTHNGAALDRDLTLEADVAIIGSGAGGGTTAEILSAAGYKVLLIEEGPLKTSSDFKLLEDEAYASLYQEGIGRMSKDGAITILQGRAVGGTTLINWTSSFRTPDATLSHWASEYAVKGHGSADMAPWFEKMEQRLGHATQRQQRRDPQRLRTTGLQLACDPAQRARLLQPGLLRHGLPGQRQAVDAGDHHPLHPGERRRVVVPGPRRTPEIQRRPHQQPGMRGDGRTLRRPYRAHHHGQGQTLRAGRWRHQQPGAADALERPRPAFAAGQAHLFAFGEFLCGAVRRGDQPVLWRAAVDLFRSLPMAGRHHRQNVVQAGGTAAAPGARQYAARRLRHPERPGHEPVAQYPRDARPAARRFPPRQPGRQRGIARRRHAGARLSGFALCLGRPAPRVPQHGRDPVRGGRQVSQAAASRCTLREYPGRSPQPDRRP